VLESTQEMLSELDYSSSIETSLVVAYAVALLKSYVPNLDPELLRKDYHFEEDEERDILIDSVYEIVVTPHVTNFLIMVISVLVMHQLLVNQTPGKPSKKFK
jgi:hypothetical protein